MAADSLKNLSREMGDAQEVLHDMNHAESDRGAAILACSVNEYALRLYLSRHMIELTSDEAGRLFTNSGPLEGFGARINLGYALGLLNTEMRDDLLLLKDIRNAFGHSPQRVGFDTQAISARCDRFHCLMVATDPHLTPRKRYTSAAKLLFTILKWRGSYDPEPLPAVFDQPGMPKCKAAQRPTSL